MHREKYTPRSYWENRLSTDKLDISVVGYLGLGYAYNYWLYQTRFQALKRGMQIARIQLKGSKLLEVGVGSGAWIPVWQSLHAAEITGVDITNASIASLEAKYPQMRFSQMDISHEIPDEWEERFDAVGAMDVLFHIVDDKQFTTAINNLSRMLHHGGWLIMSDGFCSQPWGPFYHEYHRSYDHYLNELERNKLEIVHIEPVFYTMMIPICSAAVSPGSLLPAFVRILLKTVRFMASHQLTQPFNHIPGFFLFLLDGSLRQTNRSGPGIKILFAQKIAR